MTKRMPILCVFEKPIFESVRGGCGRRGAQHSLSVSAEAAKGEEDNAGTRDALKYACGGFSSGRMRGWG